MAVTTTVKTIGTTGTFSTPQLWEDGAPASLTTAERSACTTFVGTFVQGETITFVQAGTDPVGVMLDTDGSTYMTYGITSGNPASGAVITGAGGATCTLTSGTPDFTGVIWQGQCQNQEFSGTGTQLTFGGSTVASTAYKELTTFAGASFRDNANAQTNALQYNASNGAGIRGTSNSTTTVVATEANNRISNLQVTATGTGSQGLTTNGSSTLAVISNMIVEGTYILNGTGSGVLTALATSTVKNTLVIQRASGADHIIGTGTGSPSLYNVTAVASDDHATAPTSIFLSGASGTVTVQNCGLFAGDSTKAVKAGSATFNFTTCYSDISGTTGVTQTTYGNAFQNVNDATRDFRLKSGSALINTGTTDATNAANDIVGTARPSGASYDVGCWEFIVATIARSYGFVCG